MTIVGVNNRLTILHLSKIMVHIYNTGKTIHPFSICYMINPSLKFNKIFKTQVEKCLGYYFSISKMKTMMMNNISVMALITIYDNNE